MRKFIMTVAALAALTGAAQAQTIATQQIGLSANVNGYCTIDGTSTGSARSAVVNTANGRVATPGNLGLSGNDSAVICTSNATIKLMTANGGLTNGPTPTDPNYVNKIHYTASATYNGSTVDLTTTDATTPGSSVESPATSGGSTNTPLELGVSIAATPANKFLVNGSYGDTITVTLTPQ